MNKLMPAILCTFALTIGFAHAENSLVYGNGRSGSLALISAPDFNGAIHVSSSGIDAEEIRKLSDALEQQKNKLTELQKTMNDLQSRNESNGKITLNDIQRQLDALKRDNDTLRSDNKQLADSVRSLQNSVNEQKQQINSLNSKIK